MLKKLTPFIVTFVGAFSLAAPAFAQTAPKDMLPPTGQTIAGPGVVPGGLSAVTVWESLVGVNVCVTAMTSAATATVSIRLQPANIARSFSLSANKAFSFCGASVTSVKMDGPNGATFWRIDKL